MTIPVHIECHLICLFQFPDTASSQTLITICHIIGLHVDGCILATGAINTFPIGATLSVELQILHGLVGETLRNLPAGMTVDSHIPRVLNQELRLPGIFCGRILPAIAMLQMEVRIALELANGNTQAIMLTQIAIAATTGTVLHQETFIVFLRDDIDDTCDGI